MMPPNIEKLKQDVRLATRNEIPILEVIDLLIPRALNALDECKTMDEVNEIRAQIDSVQTYIKRRLPGEVKDRKKRLINSNRASTAYLKASRIAGAMWRTTDHLQGRPPKKGDLSHALSAEESGFLDRFDARKCVKASLVEDQDFEIYIKECNENLRQVTLSGLAGIYDLLNPKEDEVKDPPNTKSLFIRLSETCEKIIEWREETEGDVYDLMTTAWECLSDAAEILKDTENEQ